MRTKKIPLVLDIPFKLKSRQNYTPSEAKEIIQQVGFEIRVSSLVRWEWTDWLVTSNGKCTLRLNQFLATQDHKDMWCDMLEELRSLGVVVSHDATDEARWSLVERLKLTPAQLKLLKI